MLVDIEDLTVEFPYPSPYAEQRQYMHALKRVLDGGGHGLFEMPSGTGKTVTILSLVVAYLRRHPSRYRRLVYCTRTVEEMEKVLQELRPLVRGNAAATTKDDDDDASLLSLGLASRNHLCINEEVLRCSEGVDSGCRARTASWVRERAAASAAVQRDAGDGIDGDRGTAPALCEFYEELEQGTGRDFILPAGGVYTLQDLRELGRRRRWCPYFLARRCIALAQVVVFSYQYLIDPRVARVVSSGFGEASVVVFDEAHNIDNVCIEALSIDVSERLLEQATRNLNALAGRLLEVKRAGARRLSRAYERLMRGLSAAEQRLAERELAAPVIRATDDRDHDAMADSLPGDEFRKADHFLAFLRAALQFLRPETSGDSVARQQSPLGFRARLCAETRHEPRVLRFVSERLVSLLWTLELSDWTAFLPLQKVAEFCSLIGTYPAGFVVLNEPEERVLHLACLDASLAVKPVFDKFQCVIITSGTLSPLWVYPRMLSFRASVAESFPMSLQRECICPLIVTRGSDQTLLSSQYSLRSEPSIARNYGELLLRMAAAVPDGVVCFFPSYEFLQGVLSAWIATGVLERVRHTKLVFIETPDALEANAALCNFRVACDAGRGAILLSVARGKAAEGIDFDGHYGRCVLLFGVPFQYSESRILRARLAFLREQYRIREDDFLIFDAMRQAAQCVGRVIRNKRDYGIMVFADRRYARPAQLQKLPRWISQFILDAYIGVDVESALHFARQFLLHMAQPLS